ncbi:retropepsin-like aspartic protease [Pedobacter sp. UBA4863]|uniref:retropepsin-like aspartic protease family protein n=1 Tax=Pedobacter sp. UBA4863 TaxID=1947060 RepID=UPI0025E59A51|nr:retropepsin-like aspartic protease [Pedobacter sp. UBA4863]
MINSILKILAVFLVFTSTIKSYAQGQAFSFEYFQHLIFLKVKINTSKSLLFLFDTGANVSAIDTKIADSLSLLTLKKDYVEGSAGKIFVPYVEIQSVSTGGYTVNDLIFTKYDLSSSLAPPGQKVDGILGMDFLKHFVVVIDFRNRLMTLSKKVTDRLATVVPFELENGIPRIKAKINNIVSTYFRYDSGSSLFDTKEVYLNTTTSIFKSLMNVDSSMKIVANLKAKGIGGSIDIPVYKINSVLLDKIELRNLYVIVQPERGYFSRSDAVGFFGNNLLDKYRGVTIDFINKEIFLNN